jgi:ribonuclease HI
VSADQSKVVTIYTDGGCRGNPGPGAWAAVLMCDEARKELSGFESETTNNRMELTAAIRALEALNRRSRVQLYTDSQYVRQGITEWMAGWIAKGWKRGRNEPVKNRDLWEQLNELTAAHDVEWNWVRGHDGNVENQRCDDLVNEVMDEHPA